MLPKIIASLAFLSLLLPVKAQDVFDYHLQQKLSAYQQGQFKKSIRVNVLLRLEAGQRAADLQNPQCRINSVLGNLATADVDLEYLETLADNAQIERVSLGALQEPVMDSVKFHTRTWAVHKKWGPISQAYQGEGVIVGIVDTGIDYYHQEFRDEENPDETRILYLWNQWDDSGTEPDSFSYGAEYNKQQIDDEINGRADIIPRSDYDPTGRGGDGHGTHVAGIAAGRKGMAPKSDMVIVSTDWQTASIIDGVKYIIDKAIALNRPVVVNLSLGSQYDLHNGTGLEAEAYQQLANLKPQGSAIVVAAGNDGRSYRVWGGFDVQQQYTFYYGDPIRLVFAIPDSAMTTLRFSVTAYQAEFDDEQRYFTVSKELGKFMSVVPANLENDSSYSEVLYDDGGLAGSLSAILDNDPVESPEQMMVLTINDHANINVNRNPAVYEKMEVYKVEVAGAGKFYSWLQGVPTVITGSIARSVPNAEEMGLPQDSQWVAPINDYSVLSPSLYPATIAVGASINRYWYRDINGEKQPRPWNRYPAGSLGNFSSRGPSIDGRIVPDLVAPGANVFSAIPSYYRGWSPKVFDGTFASSSGTSMASPAVAGAVALFLEQNPTANTDSVRVHLRSTTYTDSFTATFGALPNNHWGWGKLDVYQLMTNGIVYGKQETEGLDWNVFPNPARNLVLFSQPVEAVRVSNMSGKTMMENQVVSSEMRVGHLPAGVYLLEVLHNGQWHRTKLVVQ